MEQFFAALEASGLVHHLRYSRWSYAVLNGSHIFAVALLVGSVIPLNLRLLGLWNEIPRNFAVRILVPCAAVGLILALSTGFVLFSVRAGHYADIGVFRLKMLLVILGILSAADAHIHYGLDLAAAKPVRLRIHAILSLSAWTGALFCGRFIAFSDN